jgi:hypothetical protein
LKKMPLTDDLGDLGAAGEGDLVDAGVVDDGRARVAGAGEDVDDAGRKVGVPDDLREFQCGKGRRLGRLENDRVTGRQRRGDLPGGHQQGEVPRDDLAGHAQRRRPLAGESVLELVGPAGVIEEVGGGERDVDVAALADRLAAVHRFDNGKLARAVLDHPRNAVDVFAAFFRGHLRPGLVVGFARGLHRFVHVVPGR